MNLSETSNLCHNLCGNISDLLLTTVACSYEFGENTLFLLDRMPQENCHSFVSLVQLQMAYDRSKVERDMFSIAAMQPNIVHGGVDYYHDVSSSYFGRHHIYRPYVAKYGTREQGADIEVIKVL
jgi:hypothetical protein